MNRNTRLMVIAGALLVPIVAAALIASRSGDEGDDSPSTTTVPVAATTTGATSTTVAPTEGRPVGVYFVREGAVATAGREVEPPAVASGALDALLGGPDDQEEADLSMSTEIPPATRLLGVTIDNGGATVDLSGGFASGGGRDSRTARVSQVVYTLTQFDSVDEVTITIDGGEVDVLGEVPTIGVTRDDFADVTPLILVERPLPGTDLARSPTISGRANTFEANVQYEVLDGEGRALDSGFTTASAGNGTFGTFSVEADLPGGGAAPARLIAFEINAESGNRTNVYEVPLGP